MKFFINLKNYKNVNTIYFFIIFLLFNYIQLKGLIKLGTYWDDAGYNETLIIIYEKVNIFFSQFNNPYLGHYNYNLEFYGYLFPFIVDIIKNIFKVNYLIEFLLSEIYDYKIVNYFDLDTISRFYILNLLVFTILYYLVKFIKKVYNFKFALIFTILLMMTPSFYGHIFFNIKDIPFAILLFFNAIFIIKNSERLLHYNFKNYIIFSLGFASLLLIRINAIIFILYFLFFIFLYDFKKINIKFFINSFFSIMTSFLIMLLFSPSSWRYPKIWIEKALETQFLLSDWGGFVLTNGKFLEAQNLPSSYLFEWILFTMPLNIIVLFVISFIYFFINYLSSDKFTFFSISFIIVIFSYSLIFKPLAYDGIRQYLFLIPFFIHLITNFLINLDRFKKMVNLIIFISVLYMFISQYTIFPFNYLYLNELASESEISVDCDVINGCGNWETDYWGLSGKGLIIQSKSIISDEIPIFSCKPNKVFLNYLDSNETVEEPNEFYLTTINRPAEKNLCDQVKNLDSNTCELIFTESIIMRKNKINLSFLYFCTY